MRKSEINTKDIRRLEKELQKELNMKGTTKRAAFLQATINRYKNILRK